MKCALYYWPGIQGRGEFVRLALEEAGAQYADIALVPEKEGGGAPAIVHDEAVFARPRIRRYLASGRRLAFNNGDVFRRYPELGA